MTSYIACQESFLRFEATDEGNTIRMQCPAGKNTLLKPGCKVMWLWNMSDDLRNGTSGTILEQAGEHLIVHVHKIGKVGQKRETWNKRLISGNLVSSNLSSHWLSSKRAKLTSNSFADECFPLSISRFLCNCRGLNDSSKIHLMMHVSNLPY